MQCSKGNVEDDNRSAFLSFCPLPLSYDDVKRTCSIHITLFVARWCPGGHRVGLIAPAIIEKETVNVRVAHAVGTKDKFVDEKLAQTGVAMIPEVLAAGYRATIAGISAASVAVGVLRRLLLVVVKDRAFPIGAIGNMARALLFEAEEPACIVGVCQLFPDTCVPGQGLDEVAVHKHLRSNRKSKQDKKERERHRA